MKDIEMAKIDIDSLRAKAEADATKIRTIADWLIVQGRDKDLSERNEYTKRAGVLRATADSITAYASVQDLQGLGKLLSAFTPHAGWALLVAQTSLGIAGDIDGTLSLAERLADSEQPHLADCADVLEANFEEWKRLGVRFSPELRDVFGNPIGEETQSNSELGGTGGTAYRKFLQDALRSTEIGFQQHLFEDSEFTLLHPSGKETRLVFHNIPKLYGTALVEIGEASDVRHQVSVDGLRELLSD